jgi:hypothetical protein
VVELTGPGNQVDGQVKDIVIVSGGLGLTAQAAFLVNQGSQQGGYGLGRISTTVEQMVLKLQNQ